jgi:hypothetical protein
MLCLFDRCFKLLPNSIANHSSGMFFRHPKSESDCLKFVHSKIRERNLVRLTDSPENQLLSECCTRQGLRLEQQAVKYVDDTRNTYVHARYGLLAASEALRHGGIAVTARHYVENRSRAVLAHESLNAVSC